MSNTENQTKDTSLEKSTTFDSWDTLQSKSSIEANANILFELYFREWLRITDQNELIDE